MTCPGDLGDEEKQASALIDASIAHGVKHLVFTSVDRGGAEVSEINSTEIPHFKSKYNAEEYLKAKCAESHMTWTILRPAGFMDNLMPNFIGKGFAAIWAQIGEKPLQLVSVKDIGHFGAIALLQPEEYAGRAIGLAGNGGGQYSMWRNSHRLVGESIKRCARSLSPSVAQSSPVPNLPPWRSGDELNFEKAQRVFRDTMGYEMPRAWTFVASLIAFALPEMGQMFKWLREEGYGVDIEGLKEEYPELQDFGTWLKESSQHEQSLQT